MSPDAQLPDARSPDAQLPDAQLPDAQLPDAQLPDAQLPDARSPDARSPDAPSSPNLPKHLERGTFQLFSRIGVCDADQGFSTLCQVFTVKVYNTKFSGDVVYVGTG